MYFCCNLMFLSYLLSYQIISEWEMAVAVFLMDEVTKCRGVGWAGTGVQPEGFLSDGRSPSPSIY